MLVEFGYVRMFGASMLMRSNFGRYKVDADRLFLGIYVVGVADIFSDLYMILVDYLDVTLKISIVKENVQEWKLHGGKMLVNVGMGSGCETGTESRIILYGFRHLGIVDYPCLTIGHIDGSELDLD